MKKNCGVILTVDAIVTDGPSVVLIRRAKAPFEDSLVLPGGHFEPTDVSLIAACARELKEEVGLIINPDRLKFLTVLDSPGRDPRSGKRISIVFLAKVAGAVLRRLVPGSDAKEIVLRKIGEIIPDEIGFDHYLAINFLKGEKKMKVIKTGIWNEKWEKEMACPICKAVVLVEEADVKAVDYCYDFTAACCVCGYSIKISEEDLPLRIKDKLNKKRKYRDLDW
jgi:ADP-ribose pyrophosphatase YjhB (NUDIX family)